MNQEIKQIRINHGLTQSEMSAFTGIPKRTIGNWEDGSRFPSEWLINLIMDKMMLYRLELNKVYDENHGIYPYSFLKARITSILEKYPVSKAILFGSYAKGLASEKSDIDLYIDSPLKGFEYFGLLNELVETLKKPIDLINSSSVIEGSKVDIEIQRTGIKIYEK